MQSWTIGSSLLMLVLIGAATSSRIDVEIFRDLSQYRELHTTGKLPAENFFSYSEPATPSLRSGWLAGAVYHWFMVESGWEGAGLVVLKYLLCFGLAIGCHGYAIRQGVSQPVYAFFALIGLVTGIWLEAAQLKASLVSAICLLVVFHLISIDRRRGGFWIWGMVPLAIVWSNVHQGVCVGLLLLWIYGLSRMAELFRLRAKIQEPLDGVLYLPLLLIATTLATGFNPDGWRLASQFFASSVDSKAWLDAHQPLWGSTGIISQLLVIITFVISAYGIHHSRPWPIFESTALLMMSFLLISHSDYGVLYLVTWFCLASPLIQRTFQGQAIEEIYRDWSRPLVAIALSIGMICIGYANHLQFWKMPLPDGTPAALKSSTHYPVAATEFLRANNFGGNLLVPGEMGGYITWRLYPEAKVSEDCRLSSASFRKRPKALPQGSETREDWASQISTATDAILIARSAPFFKEITKSLSRGRRPWREAYRDPSYAIYVRNETDFIARLSEGQQLAK
jgi:hypothetical protein